LSLFFKNYRKKVKLFMVCACESLHA